MKIKFDQPDWVARDIESLTREYLADELTMEEFEDGLDDVFGINGGCGHARNCLLFMPSGSCTCGGWDGPAPAPHSFFDQGPITETIEIMDRGRVRLVNGFRPGSVMPVVSVSPFERPDLDTIIR